MPDADVAAYIGRWRPSSVSPQAAAFARDVITKTEPAGRERAKNLLWAAGKLADYAIGLGLDPVPDVVLHPSVAERFTRCAPGLSPVARRTLRTNLRFIGRRVVPQLYPQDLPLPRERAKAPYSLAEIDGFLALADAQPPRNAGCGGRAGRPGRRRRADPRRSARGARQRRSVPVRRRRGHRCRRIPVRAVPAALVPDPRPHPRSPSTASPWGPLLAVTGGLPGGGPRPRRRDRTQKPASAAAPRAATASVVASPLRGSCSS